MSSMTKLVGSVLTACHETVCPEVPELQSVEEEGEVTWIAEARVPKMTEARKLVEQCMINDCVRVLGRRRVWKTV